jgi:transcriptional regulator with XRE-family HTH domain
MADTSRNTRQKSWQGQPRRVSVLAEMALRQEKVSERLRELRELQGLSQEDAARKVGITHRQWQRWESGQSMPYPRSLDAVASAFGISIAEFFDPPEPIEADPSQLDRIEAALEAILRHFAIPLLDDVIETLADEAIEGVDGSKDSDAQAGAGSSGRSGAKRAAGKARRQGKSRAAR